MLLLWVAHSYKTKDRYKAGPQAQRAAAEPVVRYLDIITTSPQHNDMTSNAITTKKTRKDRKWPLTRNCRATTSDQPPSSPDHLPVTLDAQTIPVTWHQLMSCRYCFPTSESASR